MLTFQPLEQSEPLRLLYRTQVREFSREQLVFLDESQCQGKDFRRKYGRGERGLPAFACVYNSAHGDHISANAIAAITSVEVISVHILENDTMDAEKFVNYLSTELLPKMNSYPLPNSVLVLDNAPTHDFHTIFELCEASSVLCIFLPPYSYDYNPIELVFHEAKDYIRRRYGLSTDNVGAKLLEGIINVNPYHLHSYYRHCGY
jgi:transposase